MKRVRFGVDRLLGDPALVGGCRRLGVVTNDAARLAADPRLHSRAALRAAGLPIVRLFSPEHGITATAADGRRVPDGTDALTGLPVTSLYGEHLAPPAAMLADLDGVVFDVPDVGARFYTYAWTLTHVIDACADIGVPVWVLDRPNPAGGDVASAEGPLLEPAHFSFLGRHDIPVRHALTLGEFALLWRSERCPKADVRVVPCDGWNGRRPWHRTGIEFVPTSPAIRNVDAALLYPGLALLEATNVSVARGAAASFRAAGAPWLDPAAVLDRLERRHLPGLGVRAGSFMPATGPHAGVACAAVCFDVTEPEAARPVAAGIALLADIAALHPRDFAWAMYPTAANLSGEGHLERLLGSSAACEALRREPTRVTDDVIASWTAVPGWRTRCGPLLLYA
jgi:uncharacterized protein YbbC (DUF1343 family)